MIYYDICCAIWLGIRDVIWDMMYDIGYDDVWNDTLLWHPICLIMSKYVCPKCCCLFLYLYGLVGMCKRFTLSEGEHPNPKIEGNIHITKFTIKCLERDLKPWHLSASSIGVLEPLHWIVLSNQNVDNKTLNSVTSGLIWCRFAELQRRKTSSWIRSKFDCTINLSSIFQLLVTHVTKFQIV